MAACVRDIEPEACRNQGDSEPRRTECIKKKWHERSESDVLVELTELLTSCQTRRQPGEDPILLRLLVAKRATRFSVTPNHLPSNNVLVYNVQRYR